VDQLLTAVDAQVLIRTIASTPLGVSHTKHAGDRMVKWRVDAESIRRMLKNGEIVARARFEAGEYRYQVEERRGSSTPARRYVRVVVVIIEQDHLRIHTLYRRKPKGEQS
jgi:hypothetical protein